MACTQLKSNNSGAADDVLTGLGGALQENQQPAFV